MFSVKHNSPVRAVMHGLAILGLVFAAAANASPAYAAAPGNDLIANAIRITTASYSGIVSGVSTATISGTDPVITCGSNQHKNSVWYTFVPANSGEVQINTFGSQYNTVLAVFKGAPSALEELGCNDNAGGVTSAITLPLRGGVRYYIEVVRRNGTAITPTAFLRINYSFTNKVTLWGDPLGQQWDGSKSGLFNYSTGWQSRLIFGALNGNIQVANNPNNNAITYFDGGSFDLTYGAGPEMGNLEVYVDGALQAIIGQYSGGFVYPQIVSFGPYSDNVHKLELRHNAGSSKVNFDYVTVYTYPDVTPPAKITTLAATTGTTTGVVTLKWTAVGDDGNIGTATKYEVYYLPDPGAPPSCAQVMTTGSPYVYGLPAPQIAGSAQQVTLSGLVPGLGYYFCIRAVDEVGNTGPLSNRATAIATAGIPWDTGTYDDNHQAWTYVGNWTLVKDSEARYNTVHISKKIGNTASIFFTGSQFVYTYLTGPTNGQVDVYIDGVYTTTIDQYSFYPYYDNYYTSPILPKGPHLVRFVHATLAKITVDQIYVWSPVDGGPPAPIVDLTALPGVNDGEVDLAWTSPGDDDCAGRPTKYEIRYSFRPINDLVDWRTAQPVGGVFPTPFAVCGNPQTATATGMTPGAHYYFAVRAFDNAWYDVLSNTTSSDVTYTGVYGTAGTYQEKHSIWQFSTMIPGWLTVPDPKAAGGAYRRIENAPKGSLARFWFNGTQFRLYFLKDVDYGRLDVYVDGQKKGSIIQSDASPLWKQYWESPVFAAGNHVVEFRVVGKRANIDYIKIFP